MARPKPIMRKAKLNVELGVGGLKHQAGIIDEEFLRELRGARAIKVYREMSENDPVIGACIAATKYLVRRVTWRDVPGGSSPQDDEAAEFLGQCRDDMSAPWGDVISEILSFVVYGWALHETVYKRRQGRKRDGGDSSNFTDGKIGWRKLPIRAQETLDCWLFDDSGGIQGMVQVDPNRFGNRIELPIDRCLLFRTQTEKGNPEGRSMLRSGYVPWYRKRHIEMIEGVGIERDLAGFPVAWCPPEILAPGASGDYATIKSDIQTLMSNIRRDEQEYLMWPLDYDENGNKRWDFTLVSSAGSRQFDCGAVVERYNRGMAMAFLADVILLGHERVGSLALAEQKAELFTMGLEALVSQIENVFNRIAIPRLFAVNGWQLEQYPQLKAGSVEHVDLKSLGEYIGKLAGAGMMLFPDEELENHLRTAARLPEKPEDWDMPELPTRREPPPVDEDADDIDEEIAEE